MKRLFPRAVPEALITLLLVGGACSPSSNVKPGAPVLKSLSIIDPSSGSHLADITGDTPSCEANAKEGDSCDPTTPVCEIDANVVCLCNKTDMCDPTKGALSCTFPSMTTVLAVFDRLLATTPFDAGDSVASLSADPTTQAKLATDYNSAGSTSGLVFPVFFGSPSGPSIVESGAPALPAGATVTLSLSKDKVTAKDGKTSFTGDHLLSDGVIAFKTTPFSASVTVPAPPAMDMGGGSSTPMECPDAGSTGGSAGQGGGDAAATEGGTDGGAGAGGDAAATEGGADGGVSDAGASEAGASDASASDASHSEAGAGDAASEGGTGDAAAPTPPSTDVPLDMNMGAITITFSSPVDDTKNDPFLSHVTMTEDGKAFTDFAVDMMVMFPTSTVKLVPKTMWAAGKTYTITVDMNAADVNGTKLGQNAPAPTSFTMSAK